MSAAPAGTLSAALRAAAGRLRVAGMRTPELDARVLACHVTGLTAGGLIAEGRAPFAGPEAARFDALIARRAAGEPVARLVGGREFWGMDFALDGHTLVPRPDSETVVQAALDLIDGGPGRAAALRICDLGTGSGCLLVALLRELPNAFGVGVDLDPGAAAAARANARRNAVAERAVFLAGGWAEAIAGGCDVIVANPPYICSDDILDLEPEVARHEPRLALDGGADGLSAYRDMVPSAVRALAPGGVLVAEFGEGQRAAVERVLRGAGLRPAGVWRDLAGRERAVAARRAKSRVSGKKHLESGREQDRFAMRFGAEFSESRVETRAPGNGRERF